MASPTTPLKQSFQIKKPAEIGGKKILDTAAEIEISADPEILSALTADTPFPARSDPIRLATVKAEAGTGTRTVNFAGTCGTVTFSTTTGLKAGLGVYTESTDMLNDIASLSGEGNQKLPVDSIPFPRIQAARYFVFYWGYEIKGNAAGSVALAPGAALSFGAQGARNRGFSVIRAYAEDPPAQAALIDLFGRSWMLPGQVDSVDDLQPGTWIISEVTGAFRANLGVNLGFDYGWVRSIKTDAAEALEGDIGLRIQTGVQAAFGLSASGRYVVIVGRDSLNSGDRTIRVRLHRLQQKGWNFAFNEDLSSTGSTGTLLPEQLDDFIAAVLGVHGLQLLKEVRLWTDPAQRLSDLAAEFLTDFARNQLDEEFEQKFEEIRVMVTEWFKKWDALPNAASSALWDVVRLDRDTVEDFTGLLGKLAAPETSKETLQELLSNVHFTTTPIGRWLLGVAEKRVLNIITNAPEADHVRKAAETALDIINGKLLDELKTFSENKAGFPAVRKAVEDNTLESLSDLARNKLARFLGKNSPLDSEDAQKIRETVSRLLRRGSDLYRAGVEALNQTYKFSFDYAYSKTATSTALLDICFDFNSNPDLGPELRKAIAGDFSGVLPSPGDPAINGVLFNDAALTHHIQRQAHVRINLPYFNSETMHRVSSLAGYRLLSEEGNIYLYSLDADDQIQQAGKWQSSLSIGMNLSVGGEGGIRRYDRDGSGATINYRFIQAVPGLRTAQLEHMMDPLARLYFKDEFAGVAGADKPSIHEWAIALDKVADGQGSPEDGLIGNSMVALDVSLPGDVLLKWLRAPEDKKDPVYMEMSRRFQSQLRRFIPWLYFQNPEKYRDLDAARPLLVYSALPVTTSVKVTGGTLHLNTNRDLYWDWRDENGDRRFLIYNSGTAARLAEFLNGAVHALSSIPELRGYAGYYNPDIKLDTVRSSVAANPGKFLLEGLLYTEASIIESAVRAGRDIAKYRTEKAGAEKAVRALSSFGDRITRTFNSKLKTLFKPDDPASGQILRNLSLLMFSEISGALDMQPESRPTAVIEITVLKSNREFPPEGFPDNMKVGEDTVSIRQRVLQVGMLQ